MPKNFNLSLPALIGENVQIIFFDVSDLSAHCDMFYHLLSAEEKTKANKFLFKADKERYILARGILRKLLSTYLNIPNAAINFMYNPYGKPFLTNNNGLQFNMSHSKDKVLLGFTYQSMIGVDIEMKSKTVDFDAVAKRFFHDNEFHLLSALGDKDKKDLFFNIWVIKEAFIKAIGKGLSSNMENLEVKSIASDMPIIALHDHSENFVSWQLRLLPIMPDYAAAIAVNGTVKTIQVNSILELMD